MVKVKVSGSSPHPSRKIGDFLQTFPAGAVIFSEDDLGSEMFIIQHGQVAISRTFGATETRLAVLEKGDFFGEMALLDDMPTRSATARALTDVEALQLSAAELDGLLRRKPEIAVRMMMKLSERLREANRRYEEAVGRSVELAAMVPASANQGIAAWALLTHGASGIVFPLRPNGETSVGRHDPVTGVTPDIDLTGLDPERTVSRRHAVIKALDHTLTFTEVNASTNGSFINSAKVEAFAAHPLSHGDCLQLALVTLHVHVLSP